MAACASCEPVRAERGGRHRGQEKVKEILGVPPEKVIDLMALMGDTVDNIPGAKDPNERLAEGERRSLVLEKLALES